MATDDIGRFETVPLPWNSATTADVMEAGRRRHNVSALLEFDVSAARDRMRRLESGGRETSFTGWLAWCVSRALTDFPEFNSRRHGSRRVVRFADVDVMLIVERQSGNATRPVPFVLRRANELTVDEIARRIRAAQDRELADGDFTADGPGRSRWPERVPLAARIYPRLPGFVRGLFWRRVGRNAFVAKRMMGTVGITSVGMFGRFPGWPVTTGLHTVNLAVGGIVRKPVAVGDAVEIHEVLAVTLSADHDLVDGAPAARLVARLGELIETGAGLE